MEFKITYNGKDYLLQELIDEENVFSGQLKLIDFIKVPAIRVILATNHISPYKNMVIMQKFGALQNMISFARFNLIFAFKKLHKSPIEWKSGYEAQLFLRSNYLMNSIINYNNIKDIFLQFFWFAAKDNDYIFKDKDDYLKELEQVTFKSVDKKYKDAECFFYSEFSSLKNHATVEENTQFANAIKHHGNINFKGFKQDYYSVPISFKENENAEYLEKELDIDDYCVKLKEIHIFYVDLAKDIWGKLDFESYFEKTENGYKLKF